MALTSIELMHGGQYAKQFVTTYLESDLPGRILQYRNGWQATDEELPSPVKYLSYEPVALDAWPTIITVAISTNRLERIGFARGSDPQYRVNYVMRTYVWARGGNAEAATMCRDRLTTVVRSALLDYPALKAVSATLDSANIFRAQIDEATMREEFSDLTPLKGERYMAGAYLGYELAMDEVVMRKEWGKVDEDGIHFGVKAVGVSKDTTTGAVTAPLVLPTTVAAGGASE
jgi:hypothetical protein